MFLAIVTTDRRLLPFTGIALVCRFSISTLDNASVYAKVLSPIINEQDDSEFITAYSRKAYYKWSVKDVMSLPTFYYHSYIVLFRQQCCLLSWKECIHRKARLFEVKICQPNYFVFSSQGIKTIINLQQVGEHASCGAPLLEGGFSYDPNAFMESGSE